MGKLDFGVDEMEEVIESKNQIDSLIYSTDKSLKEHADKLDEETKKEVEKAVEEARLVKDSYDLEELKAKTDALNQASMKVGQAIYGQQQGGDAGAEEEKKDDNTVDADFEEKKEDKEEKK